MKVGETLKTGRENPTMCFDKQYAIGVHQEKYDKAIAKVKTEATGIMNKTKATAARIIITDKKQEPKTLEYAQKTGNYKCLKSTCFVASD